MGYPTPHQGTPPVRVSPWLGYSPSWGTPIGVPPQLDLAQVIPPAPAGPGSVDGISDNLSDCWIQKTKLIDDKIINRYLMKYNWIQIYELNANESCAFLILLKPVKSLNHFAPLKPIGVSSLKSECNLNCLKKLK